MPQYPAQRVGVFVDVSNMYYSARALYQARVNFQSILEDAVGKRQLVRALAYVIKAEAPEEQAFFDALAKQGWEVRQKDLQVFVGGAKKGDWDVGIAMDVLRLAAKLDVVVIVSGDGDYAELVKYVKALGTRVEAMAFSASTSKLLVAEVDGFTDLAQDTSRYIIGGQRRANASLKGSPEASLNSSSRPVGLPTPPSPVSLPALDDLPVIKAPNKLSPKGTPAQKRRAPRVTV
ncbi:MAG: NYN domain-containing protein [Patescibacteria group bacterium]